MTPAPVRSVSAALLHRQTGKYLPFPQGKRNDRIYNIHVEILGGESWRNHIVFRRKLLNHPEWVKQYCDLKRELALKYPDDRLKYTEGKAQFIKSVLNSDE